MNLRRELRTAVLAAGALVHAACLANLGDQQAPDDGDKMAWDGTIVDIIPRAPFEYMQQHAWPAMHFQWHGARQWYVIRDEAYLGALAAQGVTPAALQEGEPASAIEAAAMHRAMVELLRAKFGEVEIDYLGKVTFGQVLDGWQDFSGRLFAADDAEGESFVRSLQADLLPPAEFASLDAYTHYLWTRLRRREEVADAFKFRLDNTAGVGMHNAVHAVLAKQTSRVNMGRPHTNLFNMAFWGHHGHLDRLIEAYLDAIATPEEQALFELYRAQAAAHLAEMETAHHHGGDDKAYPADPTNGFFPTWDDCDTLPENVESSACP